MSGERQWPPGCGHPGGDAVRALEGWFQAEQTLSPWSDVPHGLLTSRLSQAGPSLRVWGRLSLGRLGQEAGEQ